MSNKPHNRFTAPPRKVEESEDATSLNHQEGGDHYKKYKIQPIEYIVANSIGFVEGSVIKYVTRWQDKGGVEDLKKARHLIDLLIELRDGADVGDELVGTENMGQPDELHNATPPILQGITYHYDGSSTLWDVDNTLAFISTVVPLFKSGEFLNIKVTGPDNLIFNAHGLLENHLTDPDWLNGLDVVVLPASNSLTSTLVITNNRREQNAPSG